MIEALAAGLPIAATDCSVSMRALIGGDAFGRLTSPRDAPGLTAAMRAVLTIPFDPAAARASVRGFTVATAAARYRALFAQLAKPR